MNYALVFAGGTGQRMNSRFQAETVFGTSWKASDHSYVRIF